MRQGKSLQELALEVERQSNVKRDLIADTRHVTMIPQTVDADAGPSGSTVLRVQGIENPYFRMRPTFHEQIASRLSIPKPYYDRMLEHSPELLAENVNHWLEADPKPRMIRALGDQARAFLSDRFRPLDHFDLLQAILPALGEMELEIKSTEITERRLYVQAVTPRIRGEVKVGDEVQAGIVISNSEIGQGSLRIEHLMWRLVCLNGMITANAMKQTHIGRSNSRDEAGFVQELQQYYSDSTRTLDDAAFFSKVTDVVRHVLSQEAFDQSIAQARESTERTIQGNPAKAVEVLQRKVNLTQGEGGGLLRHLIDGGDLSAWGVANAVTRLAHDAEDYDRSVELERLGQRVIELPKTDWREIANAA